MTPEQQAKLKRLTTDFPYYAKNCLIIRPKDGQPVPFVLNDVQVYIDKKLNEQKEAKGYIRTIILKSRQQGCSTQIAGRFYHQVTQRRGCKAFILAHREDATVNLYNLAKRFNDNCPSFMKPSVGISNAKSLAFDKLDSGYAIGTAGGGNVGRSDTIQLLHASEAAFYENTDELTSGIFQTVADALGTEIIIESTANGQGNFFHKMCMSALAGQSEYQLLFIPWFWSKEYQMKISEGFTLTEEEETYKFNFKLNDEQIMWRRNKISNFGGDIFQFKKEYPATVNEAFETSGENNFINTEAVLRARKAENVEKARNVIIGVDPAWLGTDKTAIVWRAGRVMTKLQKYEKLDTMQVVGIIINIIYTERPYRIFIDVGGIGAGIYDRLRELNYDDIVTPINFGSKADNPERFTNKRAEMYSRMKDWFVDEMAVKIPDNDEIAADISCVRAQLDSAGRIKMESKDDIRKRIGRSPDIADALALTFAYLLPIYEDTKHLEEMYETDNRRYDATRNKATGY